MLAAETCVASPDNVCNTSGRLKVPARLVTGGGAKHRAVRMINPGLWASSWQAYAGHKEGVRPSSQQINMARLVEETLRMTLLSVVHKHGAGTCCPAPYVSGGVRVRPMVTCKATLGRDVCQRGLCSTGDCEHIYHRRGWQQAAQQSMHEGADLMNHTPAHCHYWADLQVTSRCNSALL